MSHELEQFWISIYELCLTAELARLSIEIQTEGGLRAVGVPAIAVTGDPDWLQGDVNATPPVIEIADQVIALDQVVACALFAPRITR